MAEEIKQREIQTLTETIALDTYDDIFSDFDYGPVETRRLSEDLLDEIGGRLHGKSGKISIVFTLPAALRHPETEAMVRKRIRQAFAERLRSAKNEINARFKTGVSRILLGMVFLTIDALALVYGKGDFTLTFFATLIAPAGWFGAWSGLEKIFDLPAGLTEKRNLYTMLKDAEILFRNSD